LEGNYDEKCDIWSAGAIFYILFCGYPPFIGENEKDILMEIKHGTLSFEGDEWDEID
jgi:calcium-dependent protein kinase